MSLLVTGLSINLLSLQAQEPPQNSTSPIPSTQVTLTSAESEDTPEEKPNVNELLQNSTVFTNSIGMVLKKAGSLWIAAYETTQQEYQDVIGQNPSTFAGEDRPVDTVSWQDAVKFCSKLTEKEAVEEMLPDGYVYQLPTQSQWEAQVKGVPLSDAVTNSGQRRSGTSPVGSLNPNAAGIYDVRGNVAEWCDDSWDQSFRVLRGGSWEDWIEVNLRTDFRIFIEPTARKNTYGFRCVLVPGS